MKIERAWLRIIVSVIVGGIIGVALCVGAIMIVGGPPTQKAVALFLGLSGFLVGPTATAVLAPLLTPKDWLDGETRCRKCGYILKGLTEPRCSECGEQI